jgi:hypothetical protein
VPDPYDRSGRTRVERQIGYRALSGDARGSGLMDELRAATNNGWAPDDPGFKREIANALGRPYAPLPWRQQSKPKTPARRPSRL